MKILIADDHALFRAGVRTLIERDLGARITAECDTSAQALQAITLGAAYTLKLDAEIGSIECGKRADFCVLDDDPTAIDPERLKDLPVWGTVQGGRVFQAG